ncbi:hypothetical protein [Actinocrispum wychmicini]|uniref:Nitroreductase family protein n=1 Tax=Actinocrispum wychmicini TaxID=1213861 RepID=A0A4R2JAU9_9PSEU|nr:hypothetical protein [Actinocrispum wychmicini]TCO56581.1 hypothetical protein EV192_10654 [Actinocrispum wychmicini]
MNGLAAAYTHGPGKVISVGPTPVPVPVPGPRLPLPNNLVGRLLVDVLSPQRWEPWNQYNDHRAYPSPRAAYLVDVDVVVAGRRWPVDPVRRATVGASAPSLDGPVRLEFIRRTDRLSSGYGSFADALVELEVGHLTSALVSRAQALGLLATTDADGVSVAPGGVARPWTTVRRSSGVGPRGLGADPRPLPHAALETFVAATKDADPALRLWLVTRNVVGVPDGLMDEVQRYHGHPQAVIDLAAMNLALMVTADIPAHQDSYWALLRAAGALGQRVCDAAASVGMFCRPLRSFDDVGLEAALGAPVSHSLLYVLVAARPRATGFSYDLTPLEST